MRKLLALFALSGILLAASASDLRAFDTGYQQWGPYITRHRTGNHPVWGNWYRADMYGPNGGYGNHLQSPIYRGWSHRAPNGQIQGAFSLPFLNGGKPVHWKY
jgi:hypothetical protein